MDNHALARLVSELANRGETLSTCESLTAGLLSASIATVPGASAVLLGGLVTYATELKTKLAGVDPEIISRHSVISSECALAMACGVRRATGSTWAVALTGVAGPTQQDGHPVGEVWIGVAGPNDVATSWRAEAQGAPEGLAPLSECGRNEIRERAVDDAVRGLLDVLSDHS